MAAIAVAARHLRVVYFVAALDVRAFLAALEPALQSGSEEDARLLAASLRPAWAAELAHGVLEAGPDERARAAAFEERRDDFDHRASSGVRVMRGLGRVPRPHLQALLAWDQPRPLV